MSMGNSAELSALRLLFQNVNWADVGDSGGLSGSGTPGDFYIGLNTGTLTGTSSQLTNEAAYLGYSRVPVSRNGTAGWNVAGGSPAIASNVAATVFPIAGSGPETETDFNIGRDPTGAGELLFYGPLTTPLIVNDTVIPTFPLDNLEATLF